MPDFLGFQNMMILNLHGILFHAVVVFGSEHDLLLKSASTYCGLGSLEFMNLLYFLKLFQIVFKIRPFEFLVVFAT